jgi:putative transposase
MSIAGLVCYRPGHHGRLIHRIMRHYGRTGKPKGSREPGFSGRLDAAHQQLGGPDRAGVRPAAASA